ncbi:HTH-type transcriptional activator CmpR [Hartmannibacter diazotrophicus]|uniref:HTH-type transcriptional activator CmpR n=1 Tax=Hartmannibacter diazotrophicus TaxID=1482074 RepID=A0A2C9D0Z5_9HYPH|nr:LysR family transcriptional regulator [Hartmannibacter diazotrophicus]SON53916.1 HTH-type transcriptional activator CmpR [Hartmannibacter diazotrophicus]
MKSSFVHVHLVALRYFGETVRTGSIRQAAEQLNVVPSAVSRQILKLEDQLQCKLFDRMAEGVRLTAAGEVLYHYILRLERDLNSAISQIDDLKGLRRGHVRIACEDGIGRDFLPGILAAFHAEFPRVTYTVEIASSREILHQVAEGLTDIGMAMAPPTRPDVTIAAQMEMPVGIIAHPDNPIAARREVRLADLADQHLIQAEDGIGGDTGYGAHLRASQPDTRLIETNAPDVITNFVESGLGVGIRTPVGVLASLASGRIRFLPLVDPQIKLPALSIFAKPQRTLPVSGAVLQERLKAALPDFRAHVDEVAGLDTDDRSTRRA